MPAPARRRSNWTAPVDDDYYDDDERPTKKKAAPVLRHPTAPPLFIIEVDSTPLGGRAAGPPVLQSAAGHLRLPNIHFSAKPRKRAGHALALKDESLEIPHRTEIGQWAEIKWRPRLKLEIEIADVSSFAKAANRSDIPVVEVIASLELQAVEPLYAEELPLERAVRPVPRARPMVHPITGWARPPRIDVVPFAIPTDWFES
jgi:hypothetical protein